MDEVFMLRKTGTDHYAVEAGCVLDVRDRSVWTSQHRFLGFLRSCQEQGRPCFREHSLAGGQDPEYTLIPPEQLEVVMFDPAALTAEVVTLQAFLEAHAPDL